MSIINMVTFTDVFDREEMEIGSTLETINEKEYVCILFENSSFYLAKKDIPAFIIHLLRVYDNGNQPYVVNFFEQILKNNNLI